MLGKNLFVTFNSYKLVIPVIEPEPIKKSLNLGRNPYGLR